MIIETIFCWLPKYCDDTQSPVWLNYAYKVDTTWGNSRYFSRYLNAHNYIKRN